MQQINANDRVYKCVAGEQVSITLTPSDTNTFGATYTFSSEPSAAHVVTGNQIQFDMKGDWMRIFVTFFFSGATGTCQVDLNGSNGGNFTDPIIVVKTGNIPPIGFWTFQT